MASISGEAEAAGSGFQLAADDVDHAQLAIVTVQREEFDLVDTEISSQQVLVVRCHANTADMGAEITLCDTAKATIINLICDLTNRAIVV